VAGKVTIGNDRNLPPLQAADLLAGQYARFIKNGKMERSLNVMVAKHTVRHTEVECEDIEMFREAFRIAGLVK
jgi:hypothetical protein